MASWGVVAVLKVVAALESCQFWNRGTRSSPVVTGTTSGRGTALVDAPVVHEGGTHMIVFTR